MPAATDDQSPLVPPSNDDTCVGERPTILPAPLQGPEWATAALAAEAPPAPPPAPSQAEAAAKLGAVLQRLAGKTGVPADALRVLLVAAGCRLKALLGMLRQLAPVLAATPPAALDGVLAQLVGLDRASAPPLEAALAEAGRRDRSALLLPAPTLDEVLSVVRQGRLLPE